MHEEDQQLLHAFEQHRDEASFRRLYRRHTPLLFGVAMRLCGSAAEAEELTQEAWVRAVERHGTFAGRSRYRTWLVGILVNCFREAARGPRRREDRLEEEREPAERTRVAPATSRAGATAARIDVERALTRLPRGYREVVVLHDLNGYTHREIAGMLDIGEGTSKSQLMRGRAKLRELLNDAAGPSRQSARPGTRES